MPKRVATNSAEVPVEEAIQAGPNEEVLDEDDSSDQAETTTTEYQEQTLEDDVDFYKKLESEEPTEEEDEEPEEEESPFGYYEQDEPQGLKALIYGPTGSGKTWFASTFPRPLFLDMEKGMLSVRHRKPLRYPKDPDEKITNLNQVRAFFKLVRDDPRPNYETIVLDSLNELHVLVTQNVLGTYNANRQYDDQMTMADYGKVNRVFLNIVRNFLTLPYHIVMTAVETPRQYEGQEVYPKFTGNQIWPELQRMVDQIGYLHVRKGENGQPEHVVSFMLHPSYVAKDRLGLKERYIPNNFDAVLAAVPDDMINR